MNVHITFADGVTAAGTLPVTGGTLARALDVRLTEIATRPLLFTGETPTSVGRRAIWAAGERTVIGTARSARDIDAVLVVTDAPAVETSCTNGRLRNIRGDIATLYARRTGQRLAEQAFAPTESDIRRECERSVIPDGQVAVGGGGRAPIREDIAAWARATAGQP